MIKNLMVLVFVITFLPGHDLKSQGKPILVVGNIRWYNEYLTEILLAEGFNLFDTISQAGISSIRMKRFPLVILGNGPLTAMQANIIIDYVQRGGNLITFQPDEKLLSLCGLTPVNEHKQERQRYNDGANNNQRKEFQRTYFSVPGTVFGSGITNRPIQCFGHSSKYFLNYATAIALFCDETGHDSGFPAITYCTSGKGQVVAYAYNLAETIVSLRQGNPSMAGTNYDGFNGQRATDMFVNGWIDTTLNNINQADEQMQLLTHAIGKLTETTGPLPHFWYFKDGRHGMAILSGDGEDSDSSAIMKMAVDIFSIGARMTLYLIDPGTPPMERKYSPAFVRALTDMGFEVSGHVNVTSNPDNPNHPGFSRTEYLTKRMKENLRSVYNLEMRTIRNHWVTWCTENKDGVSPDPVAQAIIEAKHGINLDANYYHADYGSVNYPKFLGPPGHFNGSGIPMRFFDYRGKVLNIWQSVVQIPDDQWENRSVDGIATPLRLLVDRSLKGDAYSVIHVVIHPYRWKNEFRKSKTRVLEEVQSQIPFMTAREVSDFYLFRSRSSFSGVTWKKSLLTFDIHKEQGISGLMCMVPWSFQNQNVSEIRVNGTVQVLVKEMVKGVYYAMFEAESGKAVIHYR